MPSLLSLCLLTISAAMAGAVDPSFELFQDDLLVMVDKFYKSDREVAFLVSFLNPTEQVVKSSALVHKFLPQSADYAFLLVTPHDPDFTDYLRKVTPESEFRLKLYPKEQRTYTFAPLHQLGRPASEAQLSHREADPESDLGDERDDDDELRGEE